MFLTRIAVNNPVFATMVMVALMVFGVYSYQRLPIEQMPDIDLPVVAVVVSYPGASAESVENDIIKPIENAVNTISGIDTLQSTARSGQALIIMLFDMEVNSVEAMQEVRDKMAPLEATLPQSADKPQILRFDPAAMPVISLAIRSDTMSATDLTKLADDVVVERLRNIQGVGSVSLVGGVPTQIDVLVDPDRLDAFGVSMGEVMSAIGQNNRDLPAGTITEGQVARSIQIEGRLEQIDDFADIIVARTGGQPVRLGDVATISAGAAEDESLAFINGQRALAIDIVKVQGANTVGVAAAVHEALDRLERDELPEGVHVDVVRDNAVPVEQSFHTVQNMIIEGALLAVLIVFIFLNSWRSTVITALTLPISIIGTMIVLYALGFTLNMMTLMALSLSVGILIDDAIVVRENIMRHLHMGKGHFQAAVDGTNEIGLAVLASTLSIVAVFLPVAFMDGMLGRFFLQFGVTVSVAVMISLFVAFTLDPMMSSVWHDPASEPGVKRGAVGRAIARFDDGFTWLSQRYRSVLRWSLRHRLATLGMAAALFFSSFLLVPMVGIEFVPPTDNGEFQVEVETPQGSSLAYTGEKVRQIEALLREMPEVERTYATVNAGQGASGQNAASILVSMVPASERDRMPHEMAGPTREVLAQVPGITTVVGVASFGSVTKPVQVTLYGDSFTTLSQLADDLSAQLADIPGLADIETSLQDAQPVVAIRVNQDLASELGVSPQQISAVLRPMLSGEEASEWTSPEEDTYKLIVRLPEGARDQIEALSNLPISRTETAVVRLGDVADVVMSTGPGEIMRKDLTRQVTVDANISGVTIGDVMPGIQAAIDGMELPAGYRISMGGDAEQLGDTAASAGSALLLAVVFIYLVLASQFGSFLQPIAIMMSLPLSLVGVLLGLMVGGTTLNMMSMIGFIMLMGLVVKNAILLVDNANQRVKEGHNLYDALLEAGYTRFRPIIMTTLAMIMGMLPLALSLHEGSSQNAPMAHAVIGGLISSTLLTLVVVPVILTYIDGFSRFMKRRMQGKPAPHGQDDGDVKVAV
ncbi:nodulation protein NolG [Devosia limi DSM 17137]|uniref:AcrB/AcrD/AcrF family protein n=1 Tax=Devosia limi DSM 17137 TaxID=1121477 RepID=A0A0F5LRZ7_9HYPH|nr:efflux RND transporter permease subunit [Devosia limi]KKB85103.1 nodulation protein NolG [Devosia limi DSM 17137]SHF40314.1 AcrB/AcrD/AcrF family protein [Devosia limi DSM 17137]